MMALIWKEKWVGNQTMVGISDPHPSLLPTNVDYLSFVAEARSIAIELIEIVH